GIGAEAGPPGARARVAGGALAGWGLGGDLETRRRALEHPRGNGGGMGEAGQPMIASEVDPRRRRIVEPEVQVADDGGGALERPAWIPARPCGSMGGLEPSTVHPNEDDRKPHPGEPRRGHRSMDLAPAQ